MRKALLHCLQAATPYLPVVRPNACIETEKSPLQGKSTTLPTADDIFHLRYTVDNAPVLWLLESEKKAVAPTFSCSSKAESGLYR